MVQLSSLSAVLLAVSPITSASVLSSSGDIVARDAASFPHIPEEVFRVALEKRRGGGGRGGGSSGSSSSGSSGSSGSSSGSRGGSSGSSGPNRVSPTSNVGGQTISGTGPRPAYAGGAYAGGATQPYRSGVASFAGLGIVGGLLLGSALAFYPGIWLYGAYQYDWRNQVTYTNQTSGMDMRAYVTCLCGQYAECGCDENNRTFIEDLIGNGSYAAMNESGVVYLPNGSPSIHRTSGTIVINGTLPNGTTAPGGTDDGTGTGTGDSDTGAAAGRQGMLEQLGWWSTGVLGLTMAYML